MTTPSVSNSPVPSLIQTPGKGSAGDIIGANEMTKAEIAFAKLINNFIQLNAELSVQLANYQNAINQSIPTQIDTAAWNTGVQKILDELQANPNYQLTPNEASEIPLFTAQENRIMSQGQAETQGVQTTLTGSTNAIQALQQSMNEFITEGGSTIDTTLSSDRIQ